MWEYNNTLCHYGVLGMKWGRRKKRDSNSTSKGLITRKKKVTTDKTEGKTEDLATRKKRILDSRDPKLIYDNKHLFNKNELIDAYQIMNTENNIKNLIPKQVSKGERYIDNAIKWGTKISNLASTSVNAYNNVSKFMNTFGVNAPKVDNLQSVTKEAKKKMDKTADRHEKAKKKEEAKQEKKDRRTNDDIENLYYEATYKDVVNVSPKRNNGRSYVRGHITTPIVKSLEDKKR